MINCKLEHGSMEMWLICAAIGEKRDLIDSMEMNSDGSYPVKFEVGGVELDFLKVAQRIESSINKMVEEKARVFLECKYENLIEEITDIQDRLFYQKEKFFKYEDE